MLVKPEILRLMKEETENNDQGEVLPHFGSKLEELENRTTAYLAK